MENLKQGDVVQLMSGGPKMTIYVIYADKSVLCQWFNNEGELKSGTFRQEQLKQVEPDSGAYIA